MKEQLTYERVIEMLEAPKSINDNGVLVPIKNFEVILPLNISFVCTDPYNLFRVYVKIQQSRRYALRISCHSQDDDTKTPLFRIDYWGNHHNPQNIIPSLPERFKPFVDKDFSNESHVHYYVDGYKPLAWAVPIEETPFKELKEDSIESIQNTIIDFCSVVRIQTRINFVRTLF